MLVEFCDETKKKTPLNGAFFYFDFFAGAFLAELFFLALAGFLGTSESNVVSSMGRSVMISGSTNGF